MKVYELAKELKMETLVLMERIRQLNLPIKSHMSSLDDDTLMTIRKFLSEQKPQKKKVKRKTKKKTAKKISLSIKTPEKAKRPITTKKTVQTQAPPNLKQKTVLRSKKIIRRKKEDIIALKDKETIESTAKEHNTERLYTWQKTVDKPSSPQDAATTPENGTAHNKSRNIRSGFVAAPTLESADKTSVKEKPDFTRKKPVKKPQTQTHFLSSDFKKREVVFQPKLKKKISLKNLKKTEVTTPKSLKRIVKIYESIELSELAQQIKIKNHVLIKKLKENGLDTKQNSILDSETVELIAPDFGFEVQNLHRTFKDTLEDIRSEKQKTSEVTVRAPVVTVMGHVDHGKTTLLDALRKTDVVKNEAGGITQHIGAYTVITENKKTITFIDTPGHQAFTSMRERGAHITDIVILVVAADDGAMPQTIEALNHAKAAKVPIIVAINKIDKPNAQADKIKQSLGEHELLPEEWGGETIYCEVSAVKKKGLKELLEQIELLAEILELKAHPAHLAKGVVIESRFEKGQGPVATLLVQDGTLKKGDPIVCGDIHSKIRVMKNDRGEKVDSILCGHPVEVSGFEKPPQVGESFYACNDEKDAKKLSDTFKEEKEKESVKEDSKEDSKEEDIFAKLKQQEVKELPLIVKADVAGSLEAIKGSLEKLNEATNEVDIRIVHSGVGAIAESDILLISTLKGVILGFNVRPDSGASQKAKEKAISIHCYKVIYELLDDMKKMLKGMLSPDEKETVIGTVEVREVFSIPKHGTIAGCFVTSGKVTRNSQVRLVRQGRIIYEGKISSLRRFKDDVKEVALNYECGLSIENYNDIKTGDTIESFIIEKTQKDLDF